MRGDARGAVEGVCGCVVLIGLPSCSFDPARRKHTVRYDGDPNPYEEDLITGVYQIWDGQQGSQKASSSHASAEVMVSVQFWLSMRSCTSMVMV